MKKIFFFLLLCYGTLNYTMENTSHIPFLVTLLKSQNGKINQFSRCNVIAMIAVGLKVSSDFLAPFIVQSPEQSILFHALFDLGILGIIAYPLLCKGQYKKYQQMIEMLLNYPPLETMHLQS